MALDEHDFKALYGHTLVSWADSKLDDPQWGSLAKTLKTDPAYLEKQAHEAWFAYQKDPKNWLNTFKYGHENSALGNAIQGGFGKDLEQAEAGGPQGPDPAAQRQELLNRFISKMMGPLDQNDPEVQAVISNASHAASRDAQSHGLHGGMATSNVAQATINSQNQLMGQRQQAGLNATQIANSWTMQNKQFDADQEWKQYNAMQAQAQSSANNQAAAVAAGLSFVSPYLATAMNSPGLTTMLPKATSAMTIGGSNPGGGLSPPGTGYTPSNPGRNS